MKLNCKILALIVLSISILACNNSNSSKEKNEEQKETAKPKSAEQRYLSSVEDIHKKEKFLSEDVVSYQITYEFGNLKDELRIKAATDLSLVEIESKNFGKSYYNGNDILIDAMANMGDKEAKRNFQMVYFYHAFFHLDESAYELFPFEETTFFDRKYKQFQTKNQALHSAFFPRETTFFIEDRTNMMKGLSLATSLLGNSRNTQNVHLHYDRFITVNHIPVSLNWKFYPENNFDEESILGEAQITRIKYYEAEQLQIRIPENAKAIKNSQIL